jgi:pimeloyl-ACP methyl ester carboxylesterase
MEEQKISTLVDIGGRRLAVRSEGDGLPSVVLEMGLGGEGSMYDAIARQIATYTRVLWYDRAGLGRSDPVPTPRTIQDLVLDLHTLLQQIALPGPYLLAGHSMGGPVVRLYRDRYPEEVAALVLIPHMRTSESAISLSFRLRSRRNCLISPIFARSCRSVGPIQA